MLALYGMSSPNVLKVSLLLEGRHWPRAAPLALPLIPAGHGSHDGKGLSRGCAASLNACFARPGERPGVYRDQ